MRYNLKTLFKATTAVSLYLAVAQSAGYGLTAALLPCVWLVYWAARSRRQGLMLTARGFAGLVGLLAIWFLATDRSVLHWYCPACHSYCYFLQDRILGIPIVNKKAHEESSMVSLALVDLGVPCCHKDGRSVFKGRLWGMIIPDSNWPRFWGFRIDSEQYTSLISARVCKLGQSNPDFANEMYRQVIDEQNHPYLRDTLIADETVSVSLEQGTAREAQDWLENILLQSVGYGYDRERGYGGVYGRYSSSAMAEDFLQIVRGCYDAGAIKILAIGITKSDAFKIDEKIILEGDYEYDLLAANQEKYKFIKLISAEAADYLAIQLPAEAMARVKVFTWVAKQQLLNGNSPTPDYGQAYILLDMGDFSQ